MALLSDKPVESTGTSFQRPIYLPSNISKIVLSVDCIGVCRIQFLDHDYPYQMGRHGTRFLT
jgi:hypothetical protein